MSEQGQRAFAIHWCTTSYYTQMEVASPASRSRGGASTAPRTPLARRSHDPTILSPSLVVLQAKHCMETIFSGDMKYEDTLTTMG